MKNKTVLKYLSICVLTLFCLIALNVDLEAQCPMCRMSAESNLAHGGTHGKGLNTGILYMFLAPYILVTTLGYIWYRNKKQVT